MLHGIRRVLPFLFSKCVTAVHPSRRPTSPLWGARAFLGPQNPTDRISRASSSGASKPGLVGHSNRGFFGSDWLDEMVRRGWPAITTASAGPYLVAAMGFAALLGSAGLLTLRSGVFPRGPASWH
jgi:hypothetical protein